MEAGPGRASRSLVAPGSPPYHSGSAERAADGPRKGFNPPPAVACIYLLFLAQTADNGRHERARSLSKEWRCAMSEPAPASPQSSLPDSPDLDWLRKQAKRRLRELRQANPGARLADAQLALAKEHGFPSWRALKAHVDSLTIDGRLFEAARERRRRHPGRAARRAPRQAARARRSRTSGRCCTLAAHDGHLAAVELLLARGLDANAAREGRQHLRHALGRGGRPPGRRAAARRRGRRRRRARRRPRAGGDRLGDVLGRLRRRRAPRGRGLPGQPRRAAPHLLGHRAWTWRTRSAASWPPTRRRCSRP